MGALDGIRVIDFGQYIAGPLAAMLLADQGADVVRVDPPGGPRFATPANATWNRGKRSIVLDLRNEADQALAHRLVAGADVVVENFRPGVMERLGLGAHAMTAANPRLIYCSMPGFASDDPRAGVAAWEGVIAAATDTYRPAPGAKHDRPVYLGIPVASNFAALIAAQSIMVALVARVRDGAGQRIEVPLFDAMFTAIGARGMRNPGPADPSLDITGFGIYECADGRCVHFAPVEPRFMDWFVAVNGLDDWAREGLLDRARLGADSAVLERLREKLRVLFRTRSALEWEEAVNAAGTPLAVCRTMPEWIETPHARASGTIVEVEDPEYGPMLQPGIAVRLSRSPGRIRGPRRSLDGDRAAIIDGIGARKAETPGAATPVGPRRPALEGVRVLDLTQVWAGPTAARALAEYGADVIKINSPHLRIFTHVDVNRGKRSLLLDLADQSDMTAFLRLVESADVVMQNFRHGVAERLGIGYERLRQIRPDIIYASVSCYGYEEPWGDRRGYEVQGQAVAGAQAQFGGDGMAARLPYEINDYGTGALAAYAIALALYHRVRAGVGQQVHAALSYTATLHQSLYLQGYAGKRWDEPRGQHALGSGPLHRLYRARDGWLFLGACEGDLPGLARVPGLEGIEASRGEALASFLESRIREGTVAEWVQRLNAAGAGAHALTPVRELMSDPWVQAHGLSITREHAGIGPVTTIGAVPRLSGTPAVPGRLASPPGADNAQVLAELVGAGSMISRSVKST